MKGAKRKPLHDFCLKLIAVLIAVAALNLAHRVNALTWSQVLERARGQTVDWFMWGGFPSTNAYVNGYVAPRVKELYGVKLRQVPIKDIAEVISKILVEKQAGKNEGGEIDLMWINGENFRTCKKKRPPLRTVCRPAAKPEAGRLDPSIGS